MITGDVIFFFRSGMTGSGGMSKTEVTESEGWRRPEKQRFLPILLAMIKSNGNSDQIDVPGHCFPYKKGIIICEYARVVPAVVLMLLMSLSEPTGDHKRPWG